MKAKLIILLLCISSFSYAQIVKSIGIKSGITLSNQYWEYTNWFENNYTATYPGFYGVITADFIKKKYYDISADFGIYKSVNKFEANPFNLDTRENIPANLYLRFGFYTFSPFIKIKVPCNLFTPYILIGPRIDYYSSKLSNDVIKNVEVDITKKAIWGVNIGEGIEYRIKRFSIIAEYKFMFNFSSVIDKPAIYTYYYDRDRIRINTHVISLGIIFHIKKEESN